MFEGYVDCESLVWIHRQTTLHKIELNISNHIHVA